MKLLGKGDSVKLRPQEKFTFGQGLVKYGEVGLISYRLNNRIYIDFPSQNNWCGLTSDINLVLNCGSERFKNNLSLGVSDFPECCTARVLTDFGGTNTARMQEKFSIKDITEAIEYEVTELKKRGLAMVTATTNNEQKNANIALLNFGFKHSVWMSKKEHPETRLRLWWYPLFN